MVAIQWREGKNVVRIIRFPHPKITACQKKVRSVNCSGLDSVRMGLATPDPSTKVKLLLILMTLHDARLIFDSSIV